MYNKIIKNDIRKSPLITASITAFILIAAMLTSLAALLIVNLVGAIDNMLVEAKTPHFMQMHSGSIDIERLTDFAGIQSNVEYFQVLEFLNIEGAEIVIRENSLAGSVQDNGLSVQSETFDFLFDLDNNMIHPKDGEIYVPIYYMKEGKAKAGDAVTIHGVEFTVAGFLRDSMMNPALISSKRFLVSTNDFEKVRSFGILENLIEFRLKDSSSLAVFEAAYLEAGLEANGPPAITYSLFKVANAISDGIMIAVLVLISILVIVVTFLCIRFTLLAKVEEDYREIGVLKAVGFRVSHIKRLYLAKYSLVAGIACAFGFVASLLIQEPFMRNIRLYMGESDRSFQGLLLGFMSAVGIFFVIMLYVNGILSRFRKISAAQAIRFGAPQEKSKSTRSFLLSRNRIVSHNVFLGIKDVLSRKKLYVTMLVVVVISSFIMIVPQNIYNTISSRSFITYMGIGSCDMRLDVQQTDNIKQKTKKIAGVLAQDKSIAKYTVLTSMMFDMKADNSTVQRLKIELGDHAIFPITYSKGNMPQTDSEIAISQLNSDDLKKQVGDEIVLILDGKEKQLTVCGIYSDITNGGKTAKANFKTSQNNILWSTIPIAFYDSSVTEAKVSQYKDEFSFAKVSSIDEHIEQMFGSTIAAMQKASYASIAATIALTILITLLFMKMLVTKDRYPIAILKSMGFTTSDIRIQYVTRGVVVLIFGVIIGTILSNTLGELVGMAIISSFGASSFHFVVNPLFAYLFSPLLIAVCVFIATLLGVSDIRSLKISDHIKEA
ncbi:ABC transporter permease [Oscillospiraceae bacterium MB08-C2-2]|nr:ABC transporter permease [Oscillospiraceae bacterium MB08-C2-2]